MCFVTYYSTAQAPWLAALAPCLAAQAAGAITLGTRRQLVRLGLAATTRLAEQLAAVAVSTGQPEPGLGLGRHA